jgi:Secretion system C-terminal sorting domain/FG-GAP-like repeat
MRIQVSILAVLLVAGIITVSTAQPIWDEFVLEDNYDRAKSVQIIDVNNDGLRDLVTAGRGVGCHWWENTGNSFSPHLITDQYDFAFIEVVDLDGDLDWDIIGATYSDDSILWIEYLGDGEWQTRIITSGVDQPYHISSHDIDRDGDKDILVCYYDDDELVWWENMNGIWQVHPIITVNGPVRADAGDMDDDGDIDFVVSSYVGGKIYVAENLGNDVSFNSHEVLTNYWNAWNVTVRDVDQDGLWDIITTGQNVNSIDWLENTGGGPFIRHNISSSFPLPRDIVTRNIDGQGPGDIVCASTSAGVSWFELNNLPDDWTRHSISDSDYDNSSVSAGDLDNDGDVDVVTTGYDSDTIVIYISEPQVLPDPVILELTPTVEPVVIPADGGVIDFSVHLESSLPDVYAHTTFSTFALLPSGNEFGPTYTQQFTMTPFMNVTVPGNTQHVPSTAPAGSYQLIGRLQYGVNLVESSFAFTKQPGDVINELPWSGEDWVSGEMRSFDIATETAPLPNEYVIESVYPNPFNAQTRVSVRLPELTELRVSVFNTAGQEVAELANGMFSAGRHEFTLNAASFSSGLYFVQMEVPHESNNIRKLVLMK